MASAEFSYTSREQLRAVVKEVSLCLYRKSRPVFCALCSVLCVLSSVFCALSSVFCALCSVLCALCSVFCALCSVFCLDPRKSSCYLCNSKILVKYQIPSAWIQPLAVVYGPYATTHHVKTTNGYKWPICEIDLSF
jgi:hypothetical protein